MADSRLDRSVQYSPSCCNICSIPILLDISCDVLDETSGCSLAGRCPLFETSLDVKVPGHRADSHSIVLTAEPAYSASPRIDQGPNLRVKVYSIGV